MRTKDIKIGKTYRLNGEKVIVVKRIKTKTSKIDGNLPGNTSFLLNTNQRVEAIELEFDLEGEVV